MKAHSKFFYALLATDVGSIPIVAVINLLPEWTLRINPQNAFSIKLKKKNIIWLCGQYSMS